MTSAKFSGLSVFGLVALLPATLLSPEHFALPFIGQRLVSNSAFF
jgi:hypothetical protein